MSGTVVLLNSPVVLAVYPYFLLHSELRPQATAEKDPIAPSWIFKLVVSCFFIVKFIGGEEGDVGFVVFDEF